MYHFWLVFKFRGFKLLFVLMTNHVLQKLGEDFQMTQHSSMVETINEPDDCMLKGKGGRGPQHQHDIKQFHNNWVPFQL